MSKPIMVKYVPQYPDEIRREKMPNWIRFVGWILGFALASGCMIAVPLVSVLILLLVGWRDIFYVFSSFLPLEMQDEINSIGNIPIGITCVTLLVIMIGILIGPSLFARFIKWIQE